MSKRLDWISPFGAPQMTRTRIVVALTVAAGADALQFLLGPLGWGFADEIVDVAAMLLISCTIGFHLLLLPTFVVEFIPVVDMLPTWTACVAAVIALRKRDENAPPPTEPTSQPPPRPQAEDQPYIDV